jgi:dihydrodipicolinate synthase/N-acetylneuraminate lyase
VFPELCKKMWQESMDGKLEESRKTQFEINSLRDIMYLARSTQLAIYAIAEIKGIIKAYPRAPFVPATVEEKALIADSLKKMELI